MLLLDGSFASDQIKEAMQEGRRRLYALFPTHKGAPRSLSSPVYEDGTLTLAGSMMAWQSFTLGEIVRGHNGGISPIQIQPEQIVGDAIDAEIAEVMRADIHPRWFRPLNEQP